MNEIVEAIAPKIRERLSIGGLDTCWEWQGSRTPSGYGTVPIPRRFKTYKNYRVHRAAWEMWRGEIPEGATIDHLCRNRACANPRHMEIVSGRENTLRGVGPSAANARKTHCSYGHEFSPENTRLGPDGRRYCRACVRRRWHERVARAALRSLGEKA